MLTFAIELLQVVLQMVCDGQFFVVHDFLELLSVLDFSIVSLSLGRQVLLAYLP